MKLGATARCLAALLAAASLAAGGIGTSGADFTATGGATNTFSTAADWVAPLVTITAPVPGASTADTTPTITGTGGRLAGDLAAITVRIYGGPVTTGAPVRTLTTTRSAATGNWSATPSALAPGLYTVQAEQTDTGGNLGLSAPVTFTIDIVAPTVTIDSPLPGAIVNGSPVFSGAASSAPGDATTVTLRIWTGTATTGAPVRTITAGRSGGSWDALVTPPLPSGTYTARASQVDNAGNTANSAPRTFTVDAVAPTGLSVTTPASGAYVPNPRPAYAGRAGNATGDSPTVVLRVHAGATTASTPVATFGVTRSGRNWSLPAGTGDALPDGQYTAQIEQVDVAGNTGLSAPRTFRIDTTAPAVTITQPAAGGLARNRAVIRGTAGILTGDRARVTTRIYSGTSTAGALLQTLNANRDGATGAFTVTAANLPDGQYTVQSAQVDDAGNTGLSAPITFTLDGTRPVATAIAAANGSGGVAGRLNAGDTVDFTWSEALDTATLLAGWDGSAVPVRVRFFPGGTNDRFSVLDQTATTAVRVAGGGTTSGGVATNADLVSAIVTFDATLTMAPDRRSARIVLGAPDAASGIRPGPVPARNIVWTPSTAARDLAGNQVTTATFTETDGDVDF